MHDEQRVNPVLIDREVARRYAAEADAIMSRGSYATPDGRTIHIAAALTDATEHAVLYAASERVARPDTSGGVSRVQVVNRSSLDAARCLAATNLGDDANTTGRSLR